jgi:MoaA/NifB/PqqE/SkfB family radical SAM enzyme
MLPKIIYRIKSKKKEGKYWTLKGWILSNKFFIRELSLKSNQAYLEKEYGFKIDNMPKKFLKFPNKNFCGFIIKSRDLKKIPLQLIIEDKKIRRRYPYFNINLESNSVQTILINKPLSLFVKIKLFIIEYYLKNKYFKNPWIVLRMDIINKCNISCIMCHHNSPNVHKRPLRKLTSKQFYSSFKNIAPFISEVVLSCGSEPLLSDEFPKILSIIADEFPHIKISFSTNATLLNSKIRRLLIEKGVRQISISLDGTKKETFERIRKGANYETVISNLLALKILKDKSRSEYPKIVINFVLMDSNIQESLSLIKISKSLGVVLIDFRNLQIKKKEMGHSNESLLLNKQKFNFYRNLIIQEAKLNEINVSVPPKYAIKEDKYLLDREKIEIDSSKDYLDDFSKIAPDREDEEKVPIPKKIYNNNKYSDISEFLDKFNLYCMHPFKELMISDNGFIMPCPCLKRNLGKSNGFEDMKNLFFGKRFKKIRENMFNSLGDPKCFNCEIKESLIVTNS